MKNYFKLNCILTEKETIILGNALWEYKDGIYGMEDEEDEENFNLLIEKLKIPNFDKDGWKNPLKSA